MELNTSATTTATYSQIDLEDKEQAVPQAHAVAVLGVPHVKAVPKVEVVAPADLAGGYQFTVDLNGRVLLVSVVSRQSHCPRLAHVLGNFFKAHLLTPFVPCNLSIRS
jgi:hypothetical protein